MGAGGWATSDFGPAGLFKLIAPPPPVPGEEILDACPGVVDPQDNIESLVLSMPEAWHPNGVGTDPAISIHGGSNSVSSGSITASNLRNIVENMQIDAAEWARQDALDITILTIGLGAVDQNALRRVANDPSSAYYNSDQAEGEFVYVSDIDDLLGAFKLTAGGIARLSQ